MAFSHSKPITFSEKQIRRLNCFGIVSDLVRLSNSSSGTVPNGPVYLHPMLLCYEIHLTPGRHIQLDSKLAVLNLQGIDVRLFMLSNRTCITYLQMKT